jgi:hypothetical protein
MPTRFDVSRHPGQIPRRVRRGRASLRPCLPQQGQGQGARPQPRRADALPPAALEARDAEAEGDVRRADCWQARRAELAALAARDLRHQPVGAAGPLLQVLGVPLDTNVVEQALIMPVRYLAGSFNYKTENGAVVGGHSMSIIATARQRRRARCVHTDCLRNHEDLRPERHAPSRRSCGSRRSVPAPPSRSFFPFFRHAAIKSALLRHSPM